MSGVRFASDPPTPGKLSSSELANFVSKAREINIADDIVDLGDDSLGINLMANPNKVGSSPRIQSRNIDLGGGNTNSDMPSFKINPIDDLVDLDAAPGVSDIRIERQSDFSSFPSSNIPSEPFVIGNPSSSSSSTSMFSGGGGSGSESRGQVSETKEKKRLIAKIQRLDPASRLTCQNPIDEIRDEYDKLTDVTHLETAIKFQRSLLTVFVTGVEAVTEWDLVKARVPSHIRPKLNGWSEAVQSDMEPFDQLFEELYDLYKDSASFHPLVRLVMTLGASATLHHITNTMAEKSGIPGMAELLQENPELQRQFAAAAMAKMGGPMANFMAAANGLQMSPPPTPFNAGQQQAPPQTAGTRGIPFNVSATAMDEVPQAGKRREMRAPDVSDIFKAFAEERKTHAGPTMEQVHATVFTPSGPPPIPPQTAEQLRAGLGTPADPLHYVSGGGGDSQSVGTSASGGERRRGRPRNLVEPVGASLTLNV